MLLLFSCASQVPEKHPSGLEVVEINPSKWTALTKQNLLHLAQVYDLSPFFFTRRVQIQSQVIPHSHPVLTLNTRHAQNPNKILSVFLHEELHWWLLHKREAAKAVIKSLKSAFPQAPQTSSSGKDSTHVHLLVCYLELRALASYLGDAEARSVLRSIMEEDKIYPWVYLQVLTRGEEIRKLVEGHGLLPPPLN